MLKFMNWVTFVVALLAGLATIYSVIVNHPEIPLVFSGYFSATFFISNWVSLTLLAQLISALIFWKLGLWGAMSWWRSFIDGSYPGITIVLILVIVVIGLSDLTFDDIPFYFLFWFHVFGSLFRVLLADLVEWEKHAMVKVNSTIEKLESDCG